MIAESFSFPEINSILRWQDIFPTFNKIALTYFIALVMTSALFLIAGRQKGLVPRGVRNFVDWYLDYYKVRP